VKNSLSSALLILALAVLGAAGCDYLPVKSKPMPTSWPLAKFTMPSTIAIVAVDDQPQGKHWALWLNARAKGQTPQQALAPVLEDQGYSFAQALPSDKRRYDLLMLSPDNQYYAMLSKGNDDSYPSPTTHKAEYVFEIIAVQAHRTRLGLAY
jgi:hypothetical protein